MPRRSNVSSRSVGAWSPRSSQNFEKSDAEINRRADSKSFLTRYVRAVRGRTTNSSKASVLLAVESEVVTSLSGAYKLASVVKARARKLEQDATLVSNPAATEKLF